ncbi:MAG: UbiE/COQ5 methyltransferase [Chlorobi bacterium OLB5]|nr:MAG: UbiE/COQ5 methyltransferase [Chlorobi bacterium OLB5]
MKRKTELYSFTYKDYSEKVYRDIRKETFGNDIGQNSWLSAGEMREIIKILDLKPGKSVLEIASGSGGPAVFTAASSGCILTGLEYDINGVKNSNELAKINGLDKQMNFIHGDASERLPFNKETFDAVYCIDAINHLKNRDKVLKEIYRVLKPGGRLVYTDPIVVSGILTNEEISIRSSIGFFLFVPAGFNEMLLKAAGFKKITSKDVTVSMAKISLKWFRAREKRKKLLLKTEDKTNFSELQEFFKMVNKLAAEKRLSRIMFTAVK